MSREEFRHGPPSAYPFTLNELGLVDAPTEAAFDNLTGFAVKLIGAPVALVSIVEEENDRQYFKSHQGLAEPLATTRQTPLSHSFCQYVKRYDEPLIVDNAPEHALVCDNPAVREMDVIAYLGVPIYHPNGDPIGALCVTESRSRTWTDEEVAILGNLAACVSDLILVRAAEKMNAKLHETLRERFARSKRYNALRESVVMAFMVPDLPVDDRVRLLLKNGCAAMDLDFGCIAEIDGDTVRVNFSNQAKAETAEYSDADLNRMLAGLVISGQEQIAIHDFRGSGLAKKRDVLNRKPGSYIAAPLILNGVVYGAIEFSGKRPRSEPWSDEERSILSMIAMIACSNLDSLVQIRSARAAESRLIEHMLDDRARAAQAEHQPLLSLKFRRNTG